MSAILATGPTSGDSEAEPCDRGGSSGKESRSTSVRGGCMKRLRKGHDGDTQEAMQMCHAESL